MHVIEQKCLFQKHCSSWATLVGVSDRDAASEALKALIRHGLIAVQRLGHFHIKERHATCYRLTWEAANGRGPTNEWRDWNEPDEREAKRLCKLTQTNLRVGISAGSGEKSWTDAAKAKEIPCPSVRDSCSLDGENPEIARSPSGQFSRTHTVYHGGGGQRATAAACQDILRQCAAWIAREGYGAQGRLARLSCLTDSKMSRFISGGGARRRLTVAELERLRQALGPALRIVNEEERESA